MTEIDAELLAAIHGRVGQRVCAGKYSIEGVLGIGGMAAVYSGVHRNGRRVAMKLLHPDLSCRADIRKRFLREGQAANKVEHRGVVAVIDDDVTEDGSAFLVMERLEGKTLERLWDEGGRRLPFRVVLPIARELCEVLAVAHRVGIVHRDLKPENLFLTNEAQLKVLDFGLAQLRDAARPKETHTGMVFGTPAFMPPEQASGQTSQIDARTDIWAVGATMFTLLSGQLVHRGETGQHLVILSATQPARSLREAMPSAHPVLVELVDRALALEKEGRWQSAEAMREAIICASETLVGEPEIPMTTPTAIAERSGARALSPPGEALPLHGVQATTKREAPAAIAAIGDESSAEKTELRAPAALELAGSDPPTERRGRPGDDDDAPTQRQSGRLDAEPISDETALLATQVRRSSRKVIRAAAPEVSRGGPASPEHRADCPVLLPLARNPQPVVLPARSTSRMPYLPFVLVTAVMSSLPLIYLISRASRTAPKEDTSSATAVPSIIATAPAAEEPAPIVAPLELENVVQARPSAAPSTVSSHSSEGTAIVPDKSSRSSTPTLPANPHSRDVAAAPSRSPLSQPNRKLNCTPPYVVDANGKLHWKEECLATSKPSAPVERVPSERQ